MISERWSIMFKPSYIKLASRYKMIASKLITKRRIMIHLDTCEPLQLLIVIMITFFRGSPFAPKKIIVTFPYDNR